jgi:hypothetical protein
MVPRQRIEKPLRFSHRVYFLSVVQGFLTARFTGSAVTWAELGLKAANFATPSAKSDESTIA